MPHEWKSHLLITRCYKSAKNTASNVEDNDASFLLISPDTSVWSRQRAFYPVISLSDVCTAKKLQDHFLSFFSASLFGFAPNSLKQFELCKKKTNPLPSYQFYQLPRDSVHTAIISGFQTIGDRNQSAALLCFPLTPLSSPWRGFCCCISAFFLCTQEAREQTSECFDSCFPSPETNIETQHRHRRYLMKQRRCC